MLVRDDLKCRKCAYNLRGLRSDGRCPECGREVAWTIELLGSSWGKAFLCTIALSLLAIAVYFTIHSHSLHIGGERGGFQRFYLNMPFFMLQRRFGATESLAATDFRLALIFSPLIYGWLGGTLGLAIDILRSYLRK